MTRYDQNSIKNSWKSTLSRPTVVKPTTTAELFICVTVFRKVYSLKKIKEAFTAKNKELFN